MPAASSRHWSPATPGIGRPRNVEIIFARKIRRDTRGVFRTAIGRRDNGGVLVQVSRKHSRVKQYLKDGRAMRIETAGCAPRDRGPQRPPAQPGRAPGQSPRRQPAHTGNRTCRPGHHPCEPSL